MNYFLRVIKVILYIVGKTIVEYRSNNFITRYISKRSRLIKEVRFIYFDESKPLWYNLFNTVRLATLRRTYRIDRILFYHQTTNVRFFYGLTCLSFMLFFGLSDVPSKPGSEYYLLVSKIPQWVISTSFGIIGISTLYGVIERKVDMFLFYSEGVLGLFTWMAISYYVAKGSSFADIDLVPFFMSLWLFFRYPTHRKKRVSGYNKTKAKLKEETDGS